MSNILLRTTVGRPLLNQEIDQNFSNLNNDKLEATDGQLDLLASATTLQQAQSNLGIVNALTVEPVAPTIKPSLLLDFANRKKLDHKIDFTRATAASYFGADGLMKYAQANQPRFDHDPLTGECKGLLIEESRQNLLTYSEQFDNVAWGKINVTVIANATTAPDGTMTADKIIPNATTTQHLIPLNGADVSGNTQTLSVFVKAAEMTTIVLSSSGQPDVFFNLSNSTHTLSSSTSSLLSASIISVGNGWYRCSLTINRTSGTPVHYLGFPSTGITTGDGTSGLYIWGAQLEAGNFSTSYIPTTSATATRNADIATITGTNFSSWYRQDEGTVLVKYSRPASINNSFEFEITDGTFNNIIAAYTDATKQICNIRVSGNGSFIPILNNSLGAANTSYIKGVCYKNDNFAAAINGETPITDNTGSVPVVSKMSIGNFGGTQILNGHISKLAYYPKRLSNLELQALSQG